jgi:hypothetical protein
MGQSRLFAKPRNVNPRKARDERIRVSIDPKVFKNAFTKFVIEITFKIK